MWSAQAEWQGANEHTSPFFTMKSISLLHKNTISSLPLKFLFSRDQIRATFEPVLKLAGLFHKCFIRSSELCVCWTKRTCNNLFFSSHDVWTEVFEGLVLWKIQYSFPLLLQFMKEFTQAKTFCSFITSCKCLFSSTQSTLALYHDRLLLSSCLNTSVFV